MLDLTFTAHLWGPIYYCPAFSFGNPGSILALQRVYEAFICCLPGAGLTKRNALLASLPLGSLSEDF